MTALHQLSDLFFPPKCPLCKRVLSQQETDLCRNCRRDTEEFKKSNYNISFVAGWTAMWYYSGEVRDSILRFKFHNRRSYGKTYGRLLAMKLLREPLGEYDILTWVPISRRRRLQRGFDQVALIGQALASELGIPLTPVLKKTRHTKAQSLVSGYARRKANVMGAFAVMDPAVIRGKRILLLDDIITTGATASECARTLLTAGAEKVYCAAVAALNKEKCR